MYFIIEKIVFLAKTVLWVISQERLIVERRATRHSKAPKETLLKPTLNFQNEVTCQVKFRSKVKIGTFGLRTIDNGCPLINETDFESV